MAGSVHRVAGAVEQVLFAPQPRAEAGLPEEVRKLRVALRARAGRRTRLRAVVAPRSAIRALWDLSDRWTTVKATWSARSARLATVAQRVRRPGRRAADAGTGS